MDKRAEEQGLESLKKIYDFIIEFIIKNGYAPSVCEICNGTNIKSTSTVHHQLLVLENMGKIRTEVNNSWLKPREVQSVTYGDIAEQIRRSKSGINHLCREIFVE